MLDAGKRLAGGTRQQEVQRFGRRDQYVGRSTSECPALFGSRVAGPQADRELGYGIAAQTGGPGNAGQRGAQVALDVVGQGLERRDVEDPDGAAMLAGPGAAGLGPADRGTTGTPPGSCRCRLERGSGCAPAAIAAQPPTWAAVGAANDPRTSRERPG